jgi:hypothetical protein
VRLNLLESKDLSRLVMGWLYHYYYYYYYYYHHHHHHHHFYYN